MKIARMKRTFFALEVSPSADFVSCIEDIKESLRHSTIRWEAYEKLHITLHFMGETDTRGEVRLKDALVKATKGIPPFEVELKGLGLFYRDEKPAVLWAGVSLSEPLLNLQRNLTKCLTDSGFEIRRKDFSAHVTLGRFKKTPELHHLKSLQEKYRLHTFQKVFFSRVVLYESKLHSSGAVFIPLAFVPLQS